MSQLPPYSTFRTNTKQTMFPRATSHGNILTFTPPGFKQSLNVKFPDSRLAVCEKCKKNFKTKDICRVRNAHTAPPWTTAYVCVTIDDSCTDDEGKFIDKPMTLRMVTWRPYTVRKPFHHKTPVCASCKRTNRTRSFCRERHKHRQLPWCTVYVLLSALDRADPSTVVAGASRPVSEEESMSQGSISPIDPEGKGLAERGGDSKIDGIHEDADGKRSSVASDVASASSETISSDVDEFGDDINDIPESRTFLAKVNIKGSSIHWLDITNYEDGVSSTFSSPEGLSPFSTPTLTPPPFSDHAAAQAHYYAQAHYAHQQHQNALKSHQQYFFEMQQRQQQQYSQWQQQYAQQMAVHGGGFSDMAASGITAGEAAGASQQFCHQGDQDGASPIPTASVTSSPPVGIPAHHMQPHPWPIYYVSPPPGYYSPPSVQAAPAASRQQSRGTEHYVVYDPYPHAAAAASAVGQAAAAVHHPQLHHHNDDDDANTGDNSEDEPDAKRHRSI